MYCFPRGSLLLLFVALLVNADDNVFVYPDQTATPAWVLGDTREIKWNTTYDLVDFGFSAADSSTVVWVVENIKKPQTSYKWILNTNNSASPIGTQVFFLALRDSTNSSTLFFSQAVEITPQPLSQSDVPLRATATFTRIEFINVTQTSTIAPTTASPTDPSTSLTTTGVAATSADTSSSSLSSGAKAGVGVGVALAVLLAAALALFTLWRRRRRQTAPLAPPAGELESPGGHVRESYDNEPKPFSPTSPRSPESAPMRANGTAGQGRQGQVRSPVEMAGGEVAGELRGQEVAREVVGSPVEEGFKIER